MNMKSHLNMVQIKKYQRFLQKRKGARTMKITLKTIMEEELLIKDCWIILEPKPLKASAVKLPMYDGCFATMFDY